MEVAPIANDTNFVGSAGVIGGSDKVFGVLTKVHNKKYSDKRKCTSNGCEKLTFYDYCWDHRPQNHNLVGSDKVFDKTIDLFEKEVVILFAQTRRQLMGLVNKYKT
jgi:hypothetical protein